MTTIEGGQAHAADAHAHDDGARSGPWMQGHRQLLWELTLRLLLTIIVVKVGDPTFFSDVHTYFVRAHDIGWGHLPYRDFLWEYPPLASLPLGAIPLVGRKENAFRIVFSLAMIAVEYGALRRLRSLEPSRAVTITGMWTLAVLPICSIAYFRLDLLPMFAGLMAMTALLRGRRYVGWAIAGFALKLWPVVFGASMIVQRRWRDLAILACGCLAVIGAWWAFSPEGFHQFLRFRRGDGFQIESIPGVLLLLSGRVPQFLFGAIVVGDEGWEWVQTALNVVMVVLPVGAVLAAWRRGPGRVDQLALLGALTVTLMMTTRLLSPQFLVWAAPFVVMVALHRRRLAWIYGAAMWLSALVVSMYSSLVHNALPLTSMVIVRNALLVWLAGELYVRAFAPRAGDVRTRLAEPVLD